MKKPNETEDDFIDSPEYEAIVNEAINQIMNAKINELIGDVSVIEDDLVFN